MMVDEVWNNVSDYAWSGGYTVFGYKITNWQRVTWWYQDLFKSCVNVMSNMSVQYLEKYYPVGFTVSIIEQLL